MSNSEKESEMEPDGTPESSEEIYSSAISAVAPKVFQQEESQVEVSSSPAFQCLDEVRSFFLIYLIFSTHM